MHIVIPFSLFKDVRAVLLVLLLLSGCVSGTCLSESVPTDEYKLETYTFNVCPNPSNGFLESSEIIPQDRHPSETDIKENPSDNSKKCVNVSAPNALTNLGVELKSGDRFSITIENSFDLYSCEHGCLPYCYDKDGNDICNENSSCKRFDITTNDTDLTMDLRKGDFIDFSIIPAIPPTKITKEMCNSKSGDIKLGEYGDCMKRIGSLYSSIFDDGKNMAKIPEPLKKKFPFRYNIDEVKALKPWNDKDIVGICNEYSNALSYPTDSNVNALAKLVSTEVSIPSLHFACTRVVAYPVSSYYWSESEMGLVDFQFTGEVLKDFNRVLVLNRQYEIEEDVSSLSFRLSTFSKKEETFSLRANRTCGIPENLVKLSVGTKKKQDNIEIPLVSRGEDETIGGLEITHISKNKIQGKVKEADQIFYVSLNPDAMRDDNKFATGRIIVTVDMYKVEGFQTFSRIVIKLRDSILKLLYGEKGVGTQGGAVGNVYKTVQKSIAPVVQASIILYITVYGFLFLFGMVRTPQAELLILMFKMLVIVMLFSDRSWVFFNENLFQLFVQGSNQLINYFSANSNPDVPVGDFLFLNKLLNQILSLTNIQKIITFIFSGWYGIIFFIVILYSFRNMLLALLKVVILYIVSLLLVAILLCLAPIFLSMIFFKKTKAIFDNWIKNLAQTAITPVIAFASFAVVSELAVGIIHSTMDFNICPTCIVRLTDLPFEPCVFSTYVPDTYDPSAGFVNSGANGGLPLSFARLLTLLLISHVTLTFVAHATVLSTSIFGAIGSDPSTPAESFSDSMRGLVGKDRMSQARNADSAHHKELNKEKDSPKPEEK